MRRRIGLATFHRKLSYSMGIDSAERFVFSFMYLNTQFRTKTQFTFRMKKVESSLLVRFSTEAFKIAHARETCLCFMEGGVMINLNETRQGKFHMF